MNYRIEISPLPHLSDARAEGVRRQIEEYLKLSVRDLRSRDVYTLAADLGRADAERIAELLYNPVTQMWRCGEAHSANWTEPAPADFVLVIGFRPGVTDNVARTFRSAAADILGRPLAESDFAASSVEYLISSQGLTREAATSSPKSRWRFRYPN